GEGEKERNQNDGGGEEKDLREEGHRRDRGSGGAGELRATNRSGESQLDVLLQLPRDLQQRVRPVTQQARQQGGGELLDHDVVDVGAVVEQLAPVGDGRLQLADPPLDLEEVLAGLEVGIRLQVKAQPGQLLVQLVLDLSLLLGRRRLAVAHPEAGELVQHLAL